MSYKVFRFSAVLYTGRVNDQTVLTAEAMTTRFEYTLAFNGIIRTSLDDAGNNEPLSKTEISSATFP